MRGAGRTSNERPVDERDQRADAFYAASLRASPAIDTEVRRGAVCPDASHPATSPRSPSGNPHSDLLTDLADMRAARQQSDGTLTLVLLDPDRFHELNEQYSPRVGDNVLSWIESTIAIAGAPGVPTARFAGDQFISLLPDMPTDDAVAFAERCGRALAECPLRIAGRELEVTLSVGVVESSAGCPETPHQLIQRARIALDHAKQGRGGRIVTWAQVLSDPHAAFLPATTDRHRSAHWNARLRQHVRSTQMESMRALVAAVDARDSYTRIHSQTVAAFAEGIGRAMQLRGPRLDALMAASLLHDVGKIGVPDAILAKPGPLTPDEFETVKRHPQTALDILRNMSFLTDINPLILHHHERFDGSGYPAGLKGDDIPIGARIIAVADAIDTMLSPRTYKAAYGVDRTRAELRACSGTQFDPQVTRAALQFLDRTPTLAH